MIVAIIVALLFVLLASGAPIGFALAVSGTVGLYMIGGLPVVMAVLSNLPRESAAVFEFLTIPMFLLMAEFILRSGIADDLFEAVSAWIGRFPGGLGMATALSGAGFGAICGSSTAAAVTLSSTSLSAMLKHGYEPRMASGVVAISGTLAMLIPPSVAMVIYGLLSGASIAKLLIAGFIPGLMVTGTIVLTTFFLAKRHPDQAPLSEPVTLPQKIALLRYTAPILILLMAVTGAIYTGVATPTEASAIGALCAAMLYFARTANPPSAALPIIARATRSSCMLALIMLGAKIFATFFTLTQTTQSIISWVGGLPLDPWIILLVLVSIYLLLGCLLDQMAILVLTVPTVAPLVISLGYDPIWFGVIMIIVAELGLVTPPLGLNVFVVSKYSGINVEEVFRGVLPHVAAHILLLAVLLTFPVLTLWLPSRM